MISAWSFEMAGERIVLLGAVLAAVAYIVRSVWKTVARIVAFASRLDSVMSNVEAQLYPNGGRTLRDAVDRIQLHLGIQDVPGDKESPL